MTEKVLVALMLEIKLVNVINCGGIGRFWEGGSGEDRAL